MRYAILDFKSDFDKPICKLLPIILACDDGCPNTHYSKVVHETDNCGETDVPRKGHSLLCFGLIATAKANSGF